VCCFACRSHPKIFISASFVPSFLVGYRKVYSGRREADVVMSSATGQSSWRDVEYSDHVGGTMLLTRLLPLLYLLSLSSAAVSQDRPRISAAPNTCSVTKPANQPFVPPPPYPAKPSRDRFWFGTDRLWTALP